MGRICPARRSWLFYPVTSPPGPFRRHRLACSCSAAITGPMCSVASASPPAHSPGAGGPQSVDLDRDPDLARVAPGKAWRRGMRCRQPLKPLLDPVGIESHPAKAGRQPEASLAWLTEGDPGCEA